MLIAGAGMAMIAGARRLAVGLLLAGAGLLILPVVLEPVFGTLPVWLLAGLLGVFALTIARALFVLLIGERATEHMVGILAADVVRAGILAPFRMMGWLVRTLFSRR